VLPVSSARSSAMHVSPAVAFRDLCLLRSAPIVGGVVQPELVICASLPT
jgi:hypothetical protein